MTNFRFDETEIQSDMTDGDAIDFLRLTCKANGLRRVIATRGGYRPDLRAALDATKADLRDIATRYA